MQRLETEMLGLSHTGSNEYVLVPPHCAVDRSVDLEEAHIMRSRGETEIARDELLYLVSDCRGFIEAHYMLGEMALEEEDIKLARGHFGFAYECGMEALPPGFKGRLPADEGENRWFFESGRGLARCLIALGKPKEGREVLQALAKFDSQEEQVRALLAELASRESEKKGEK